VSEKEQRTSRNDYVPEVDGMIGTNKAMLPNQEQTGRFEDTDEQQRQGLEEEARNGLTHSARRGHSPTVAHNRAAFTRQRDPNATRAKRTSFVSLATIIAMASL
jgi:hypothetical protein